MGGKVRIADSRGRVSLPGFANATVIIEAISDTEVRVRKAEAIQEDELVFSQENMPIKLTEREACDFMETFMNPPKPNAAARRAARRFKAKYG